MAKTFELFEIAAYKSGMSTTNVTCNKDRGLDYHLMVLGIKDRAPWEIIANDDRIFRSDFLVTRPDWVLHNTRTGHYLIVDYKSRVLHNSKPSEYEKLELVIASIAVRDVLGVPIHQVKAALVYGCGTKFGVEFDENDEDKILRATLEICPEGSQISASQLATMLSGNVVDISSAGDQARQRGTDAHKSLMGHGVGQKRKGYVLH